MFEEIADRLDTYLETYEDCPVSLQRLKSLLDCYSEELRHMLDPVNK